MGKNSLVQSTTKGKKKAAKKKAAKKTAVKAKAVAKKTKAAPKKEAAAKAKIAVKTAPKAKAAPAPKKKAASVKDLLKKKFPVWKPEKLYTVAPDKEDVKDFTAPPFVSGSEEEQKRVKELLLKTFDMAEIKAAGEKAAVDKAAAEKAAAEKAAAEKAAAEKAAAEKAAAEKAAAEPEVSVSYVPPDSDDTIPSDPMDKAFKYMAAAFALLIALVVGSSMINQGKYYIQSTEGALKIFQGRFAPMGEKLLISLPGVQAPEKVKDVYSKTDVFPIIFNYYVEKADTLLKVPGLPDFQGIKKYINKAKPYAITPASKDIVYKRLSNIDLLILLYKADVAASKPALADLKEAKAFLSEASRLDIDDIQLVLIHKKMDAVDKKIDALKAEQKKVKSLAPTHAPAPPAKTEAPAHSAPAAPEPHAKPNG